jgi:predicted NUDIX family NTP pyrophosphohydrolase
MPTTPRTPARSAGVLVFRRSPRLEVLIGHLGGPFWARKHQQAWSAPKGLLEPGETPEEAAAREFTEETGLPVPEGTLLPLGAVRASGGKTVELWAVEADPDLSGFSPGTFPLEWPPRSGTLVSFPEIDRLEWAPVGEAAALLVRSQLPFLDRLQALLTAGRPGGHEEP